MAFSHLLHSKEQPISYRMIQTYPGFFAGGDLTTSAGGDLTTSSNGIFKILRSSSREMKTVDE